jgi:hypothetical protein
MVYSTTKRCGGTQHQQHGVRNETENDRLNFTSTSRLGGNITPDAYLSDIPNHGFNRLEERLLCDQVLLTTQKSQADEPLLH